MWKIRVYLSLILFLVLMMSGGQVLQTDAYSIREEVPFDFIDQQVWKEILESPDRQTTFIVQLKPEGELSIDAQFRLEEMLAAFQETGNLGDYRSYYGRNIIKIIGGAGILHFLRDWPEVLKVSPDNGEALCSEAQAPVDLEIRDGTSQISGTVTAADGLTPLSGIRVTAYLLNPPIDWVVAETVFTGSDGTYTMSGLAAGIYRVRFVDPSGNYVTEYFDNKSTFALATNFDLGEGETKSNINAALSIAGKISGTISLNAGGTEAGLVASAWSNASGSWNLVSNAITDGSGGYLIGGLAPGNYRVEFSDSSLYVPPRFVTEYYDNQTDIESAQDITVTGGSTTPNIDAELGTYGSVSGNVKDDDGITNLENIYVDVYRFDTTWEYYATGITDSSGNYEVFGLGSEDVRVGFFDPSDQYVPEFFDNKPDLASGDNVAVDLGYATININAELMPTSDLVTFDKETNGEDAENPPGPYIAVGDLVSWTYAITNNGIDPLTFSIVDNPPVTISCPKYELLSGESTTCTASGAAVKGQYSNTATVSVTPSGEIPGFDVQDTSHYFGVKPGIDIEKSTNGFDADLGTGPYIEVGEPVIWTYEITNTGNISLTGIVVTDDQGVAVSCPNTSLAPDTAMTCTASGTAVEGQYTNLGSVTGNPPTGFGQVSDSDFSHYFGTTSPIYRLFLPMIMR
jgi:hypothetical protein